MKRTTIPPGEDDFVHTVTAYGNAWQMKYGTAVVNRHANKIVRIVDTWHAGGSAIEHLHHLLESDDPAVQLAAANSLVRLATPERAVPILQALAVNGSGRISLDARAGLMLFERSLKK